MSLAGAPYRDPASVAAALAALGALPIPDHPLTFMHVCGTHENAIARFGLRRLLPPWLRLIAGPGCPVCVCPAAESALAAHLALEGGALVATFGDMLRVPGALPRHGSLEDARGRGGDMAVVLGAADAVALAQAHPAREVVFFAVGFETTACTTAAALLARPPANFSVLCAHRRIPPALEALLALPDLSLDGFLLPGHVLAVTGTEEYEALRPRLGRPMAVAGFEPLDILLGLLRLTRLALEGRPELVNAYPRVVRPAGNPLARAATARAFDVAPAAWRGLGTIPGSGLVLREELAGYDARLRFAALAQGLSIEDQEPPDCRCGLVMSGRAEPEDCPLFGSDCIPEHPVGACMVGAEGTCRARWLHRDI
jgi:hydrogenase expression/formation protein HypD